MRNQMAICVLTISSEQGTTPARRNWKYVTMQKMAINMFMLCLYISKCNTADLTISLYGSGR